MRIGSCWRSRSRPSCAAIGVENAYEQLKSLTRGQRIDAQSLRQFIGGLAMPEEAKQALLELSPAATLAMQNSWPRRSDSATEQLES